MCAQGSVFFDVSRLGVLNVCSEGESSKVAVGELVIEYGQFYKVKYEGSNERATIKLVLGYLIKNYKTLPAAEKHG
ncbi:hypothetical protein N9006_01765 [bacterium]|mgnify:CR=1 FL=1|jgi:hypothetical protein|nr:hypothetical protein [bacterium]MDB4392053.1 hypothetical protein [bacterium]